MNTVLMFAIASGPPIETRSGHLAIHNSWSDLRLLLQRSPGMDTIPWHEFIHSDSREVRFSKQHLGDQAEKSPQLCNLRLWMDGGNTIALYQ